MDEPMTLDVAGWVNSEPVALADLRGRVVVIEAFQMLCPGCVSHGLPQAQRIHRAFRRDEVVVLGLHTVFEHHDVMGRDALEAFLHEYRIALPVAIDRPQGRSLPATMARYGLQGTPSTLLVDRSGRLRHTFFGALDDLVLGVHLGQLLTEQDPPAGSGATGDDRTTAEADATGATARAAGTLGAAAASGGVCGPDGCSPS